MKSVLFICPYPKYKAPSQRFRFEQYLDFIEKENFSQKGFWNDDEWPKIYEAGSTAYKLKSTVKAFWRRCTLLFEVNKYDIAFIHREATPIGPPWFEWTLAKVFRKPIIFDFDDAIWLPNSSKANEKLAGKLKFHGKTAKICSWAKTVVVGNSFLADYAKQYCNDVRIIPTTIDTEHYHNPDLYEKIVNRWRKKTSNLTESQAKGDPDSYWDSAITTIGWTGTHSTLKQLIPLFPLLTEIYQFHPFRFLLIADVAPDEIPVFMKFRKWKKETEIEDLMEIEIGIMPLYNTDWEKGKCGFKALQYMALSIPTVVSAVGANVDIVGNSEFGLLAEEMPLDKTVLWKKHLLKLMENNTLRTELGLKGRQRVVDSYSISTNRKAFKKLFN